MRSRMWGVVGTGRENPPVTRLSLFVVRSLLQRISNLKLFLNSLCNLGDKHLAQLQTIA